MMSVCGSSDADQMLFTPTWQECLRDLAQPIQIKGINITDKMRFMNGDNPSVEFEDETQKGGHRGCVGCGGDVGRSSDVQHVSHRKYHTLEEKQNLVLAGPEGRKGGLYQFKNLKVEQIRKEVHGKHHEKDMELYGDIPLSLKDLNLEHYEFLFFSPCIVA